MNLTPTERAVARHLLSGYARVNISAILDVAESTTRTHINSILQKSSTRSTHEFAMRALRSDTMLREIMEIAA